MVLESWEPSDYHDNVSKISMFLISNLYFIIRCHGQNMIDILISSITDIVDHYLLPSISIIILILIINFLYSSHPYLVCNY